MEFENNKIDRLASLVEEFIEKYPVASSGQSDEVLNRLEAKVDVIAQTGGVDYFELALTDLKQEIEEKQNIIEEKVGSLEDIVKKIINISTEIQEEKIFNHCNEQIEILKDSVCGLKDEFWSSQSNINKIYDKLDNTTETDLESLKSSLSSYEQNFNAINSRFDQLKFHIENQAQNQEDEYIKNTLEKLELITTEIKEVCKNSQTEKIDQLKGEVQGVTQKFDAVFELLKAVPSEDGVEEIKLGIADIEERLNEFSSFLAEMKSFAITSYHSDSSSSELKEGFSNLENVLNKTSESINFHLEKQIEKQNIAFGTEVANHVEYFQHEVEQLKESSVSVQNGIENLQLFFEEGTIKNQFEEFSQELKGLESYFKDSMDLFKKDLSIDMFNQNLVSLTSLLKDLNNYIFENVKSINDKLPALAKSEALEEFRNSQNETNTQLIDRLETIREIISQEKLDSQFSEIKLKIEEMSVKEDLGEVIGRLECLKDRFQVEEVDKALNEIKYQVQAQESSLKEEIYNISDKVQGIDFINENMSALAKNEDIEDLQDNLNDKNAQILANIEDLKDKVLRDDIDQKLSEVTDKIEELPVKDDIYNLLDKVQNIDLINDNISNLPKVDLIEALQNNLSNRNNQVIASLEELKNKVSQDDIDQKLSEVKNKIEELSVKDDVYSLLDKVQNIDSINDNISNLPKSETIEDLQDNLNDKNIQIIGCLEEIKHKVFQDDIDQKLSEVKNKIEELSVKDDVYSLLDKVQNIDSIKDNISNLPKAELIEALQDRLNDKNIEIIASLEEIKHKLSQGDIEQKLSDITNKIEDIPTDKLSQEYLEQKLSEVTNKIEYLSISDDMSNILDKMQSIDSINDNISNLAKKETVENLQNNLNSRNNEIIAALEELKDKASQLQLDQTVFEVNKQEEGLSIKSEIENVGVTLNKISESVSSIEDSDSKLVDLQQRSENFAVKEDISVILDKLQELKDHISALELEEQIDELKDSTSFNEVLADFKSKAEELYVRDEVIEIIGRLEELKDRLAVEETKEKLNDIEAQIQSITIKDEIAYILQSLQDIKEKQPSTDNAIVEKLDELNSKLNDFQYNSALEDKEEKSTSFNSEAILSLLNAKFEEFKASQESVDINTYVEEVENQLLSLETEEKFEELSFKLEEVKNSIKSIGAEPYREPDRSIDNTEGIQEISEKIEYIKDKLQENSIKDEVFNILNDINIIKSSLGVVEHNPETPGLDAKISIIYEELNELKSFVENLAQTDFSAKLKTPNNNYNSVLPSVIEEAEKAFDRIINIALESKRITEEFAESVDNSVNVSKDTNERVENLLKNISAVNDINNELSSTINNNTVEINRLNEIVSNYNSEINLLHDAIDNNNSGINKIYDFVSSNSNNNNNDNHQLSEAITETINENIAKLSQLCEAYNSSNGDSDEISRLNETVSNNYSNIISKQEEIKSQIKLNSEELIKLSDLLEETSSKNVSLTPSPSSIMDLRNDMTNIFGRFNELKTDLSDLTTKTSNFMRNTSGDAEFIKSSLNECRQLIESPTKEINDRLNKLNSNFDSSNEGLKNNLVQISFSVQDSRKHIIKSLKDLFNMINRLSHTVNNNQNSYMTIKNILVQLAEWIDSAGHIVEDIKDDVKDIKDDKLKKLFVEFKLIKEEMQAVEQKHSKSMENLLTVGNQKNEELQSIIVSLKNELNNALEKFDSNFIKVAKKIDKLEGNIGNALAQSDNEHKELKSLNTDILSKLKEMSNDLSLSREDMSLNYKRIEGLMDRSGAVNNFKLELNALIANLEQNNTNNFQKLDTELTSVSQQMSNINHSISAYEARVREELRKLSQSMLESPTTKESSYDYEYNSGNLTEFEDKINYLIETSFKQMRNVVDENLKRIYSRFSNMEVRFQHLDKKLDGIQKAQEGLRPQEDRSILEFIAGQVTAMNETGKNSNLVMKRMDTLEKRILDFDLKLNKLVGVLDKFEDYPNEYSDASVDTNF